MHLYTFAHTLQVFILGFMGGMFISGLILSKLKWSRTAERKIAVNPIKRKIPSVPSTEYSMADSF